MTDEPVMFYRVPDDATLVECQVCGAIVQAGKAGVRAERKHREWHHKMGRIAQEIRMNRERIS